MEWLECCHLGHLGHGSGAIFIGSSLVVMISFDVNEYDWDFKGQDQIFKCFPWHALVCAGCENTEKDRGTLCCTSQTVFSISKSLFLHKIILDGLHIFVYNISLH